MPKGRHRSPERIFEDAPAHALLLRSHLCPRIPREFGRPKILSYVTRRDEEVSLQCFPVHSSHIAQYQKKEFSELSFMLITLQHFSGWDYGRERESDRNLASAFVLGPASRQMRAGAGAGGGDDGTYKFTAAEEGLAYIDTLELSV